MGTMARDKKQNQEAPEPAQAPAQAQDQAAPERAPTLLDADALLNGTGGPGAGQWPRATVEVPERPNPDGSPSVVNIWALHTSEMDELNSFETQYQRAKAGQDADKEDWVQPRPGFHWDALLCAAALRTPEGRAMHMANGGILVFSEQITQRLLPGTITKIARRVLDVSGFGPSSREKIKKD